jgi:acylphosphatase
VSTARFLVRGRVQGVGFRWFVSRQAQTLGVTGYVRNLMDGSVEVLASSADPAVLQRLEESLGRGPRGAAVVSVQREDRTDESLSTMRSFDIR